MTKKERLEHKRKSINAAIKNLETKALEQHAKIRIASLTNCGNSNV